MIEQSLLLPLDSEQASLARVGGKGANLARLARAGFPVPGGFLIPVDAYRQALSEGLDQRIAGILSAARLDDPTGLEAASSQIRALFSPALISPALAEAICAAYRALGSPPVAVRSSATAEDLPDLSFAGQQDTYLNIRGEQALLRAVADCWGSLWTARAIGYRQRQGVGQADLALAVVVQTMVPSESSGVLFSANPLTGLRSQTVIDATFGLGEALVSGKVEPDRYLVDRASGQIVEKKLGAKALSIRPLDSGGVETVAEQSSPRQALPDDVILSLASLGQQVAGLFGSPQDIEWAWAGGQLFLLQSRPITSLYPVPERKNKDDLRVYFSFGAVQGMLDPVTPLGIDMFRLVSAGGGTLFGFDYNEHTQTAACVAGERLWIDFTTLVRNPFGRKIARAALRAVEPTIGQNLELVWNDPRLVPTDKRLRFATFLKLARFFGPLLIQLAAAMRRPEQRRRELLDQLENEIAGLQRQMEAIQGTPGEKLHQRIQHYRQIRALIIYEFPQILPLLAAAMSQFNLLLQMGARLDEDLGTGTHYHILAMEITRGVPGNVTTEMDLALWDAARALRVDPAARSLFLTQPAGKIAQDYLAGNLPPTAQSALDRFLNRYGLRGLAEIDMGRQRWVEDPTHVVQVLGSYLQIEDESAAPDVVFARGQRTAAQAVEELAAAARRTRGGWFKARLVRFAARRARALIGIREAPKFYAIRVSGLVRQGLLQSGRDFVQQGAIDDPQDLFFLDMDELDQLASGKIDGWKEVIAARRASYEREMQRRQIPRLLLSDGRAFYEGIAAPPSANGSSLHGDPVSPGLVEGTVRVVLDPRGVQLTPGEILVCPGTDPSWTPLFLAAGGLVMEVGGLMTHGAVVAREYGIPAVVGVHQATTRLQTGQRIRVNGSTGEIELLTQNELESL